MRPGFFYRLHLSFIRFIAKQVELVINQIEINNKLRQINQAMYDIGIPRIQVKPKNKNKKRLL